MNNLTDEQVEFAVQMVCQWMRVCEDHNRNTRSPDADHSALLRRLLKGKPLLEKPPPRRFSYPAWEMVEEAEVEISELKESDIHTSVYHDGKEVTVDGPVVVIDQCAAYVWDDKEQKIVRHVPTGMRWQYFEKTAYPIWVAKELGKVEDHPYMGKFLRRL